MPFLGFLANGDVHGSYDKLLDLVKRLQPEATAAGGRVHALLVRRDLILDKCAGPAKLDEPEG